MGSFPHRSLTLENSLNLKPLTLSPHTRNPAPTIGISGPLIRVSSCRDVCLCLCVIAVCAGCQFSSFFCCLVD